MLWVTVKLNWDAGGKTNSDEREEGKTGEDPKVARGSDKKNAEIKVEDEPKPQEALILMNKKPL